MSITAEKISKERIEELRCRADDVKRYSKAPRPTMAVFADDILAILSLLQQGEPEGYERELDAKLWCALHGKNFRSWDGTFCAYTDSVGDDLESWVPFYQLELRRLSASPLPPAPGALPRSSSRQAVLEEAAVKIESYKFKDADGVTQVTFNRIYDELANEIRALATTPPAEGETK